MDAFPLFINAVRQLIIHNPDPWTVSHAVAQTLDQFLRDTGWDGGGAAPDGQYEGRMIYEDPSLGFIAVAMAWAPGAATPIHDHGTWGVMGVTCGRLAFTNFKRVAGTEEGVAPVQWFEAEVGTVTRVVAPDMEIHQIHNPGPLPARSIHIYGRNIGF